MSIQYKMIAKNDNLNAENSKKGGMYPVVIRRHTVSLSELAAKAAASHKMNEIEIEMAVRVAIKTLVRELLDSNHVHIDGFGTFSLGAESRNVLSEKELRAESVSVKKLKFKTSPLLLRLLKNATFERGK